MLAARLTDISRRAQIRPRIAHAVFAAGSVGVTYLVEHVRRGDNRTLGALTCFLPVAKLEVVASAADIIGDRIVYAPPGT